MLSSYSYTLDSVGNRLSVLEENNRQVNYTYDELYRLTEEDIIDPINGNRTITYTYDAVGNRLTQKDSTEGITIYTYDANDRLLTRTLNGEITQYTYDDNGNVLSQGKGSDKQNIYNWDPENHLIAAQVQDSSRLNLNYRYNPSGIRVALTVNGEETCYLLDTQQAFTQVVGEYDSSGNIEAYYVYGNDLISQVRNEQFSFYLSDGQGSKRQLINQTGAVTDTYTYSGYGELIQSNGSTQNNYRFVGEQYDPFLSNYYLRARYYDPEIGRFTAKDPHKGDVREPLSLNKYIYVNDNPINSTDPSGLFKVTFQGAVLILRAKLSTVISRVAFSFQILRAAAQAGKAVANSYALARQIPRVIPIPMLVYGLDLPITNIHVFKAITLSGFTKNNPNGIPLGSQFISPALTYIRPESRPSRTSWYPRKPPCKGKTGRRFGLVCDEYPYNSVKEGGQQNWERERVSLYGVPEGEQIGSAPSQGIALKKFYEEAKVNGFPGSPAAVFANFASTDPHTVWYDRFNNGPFRFW
ncbi:MAG: hypothetical protein HC921_21000 [Synechococcaceae cyanobacterium SM2_3_1]|nr:hypothetical protein [Synechococcaceae cyanobacterium SM2_3_1]